VESRKEESVMGSWVAPSRTECLQVGGGLDWRDYALVFAGPVVMLFLAAFVGFMNGWERGRKGLR